MSNSGSEFTQLLMNDTENLEDFEDILFLLLLLLHLNKFGAKKNLVLG